MADYLKIFFQTQTDLELKNSDHLNDESVILFCHVTLPIVKIGSFL